MLQVVTRRNTRLASRAFGIGPEVGQPGDELPLHGIPSRERRLGQRRLQQPFQVDAAARVDHQRRGRDSHVGQALPDSE